MAIPPAANRSHPPASFSKSNFKVKERYSSCFARYTVCVG